jgi:membrane associated rhomboid family serine protease
LLGSLKINTILILANILAFIAFSALIYLNPAFLEYIALKPSNILQGKYLWTFLTSIFMHSGFFHIFVNMLSLFFVGSLVERIIGPKRYLLFYVASGLFAGAVFVLSSLIIPSDLNTFAVGASGAIFALVGALMVLTPNLPVYIMFIPLPVKMKYAAPLMLIALWLISLGLSVPIGNVAHLGGLVFGLLFGFYLRMKYKRKTKYISKYFSR